MKKALHISFLIILFTGTVVLLSFTDRENRLRSCSSFVIEVLNPSETALITKEEIQELVSANFGMIEGAPLTRIDLYDLETLVEANPYVSHCEVFHTIGGGLMLISRVREPLVRIINQDNRQYYLDRSGFVVPMSPVHPSHVIVANGLITDSYVSIDKTEKSLKAFPDSSVLKSIYPVALQISRDEFLNSFIDQIYVNESREIELVPKIGSQIILFGNSENVPEKLENLRIFYKEVMSRTDWKTYKTINLKYKNQVVCTKTQQYEQK